MFFNHYGQGIVNSKKIKELLQLWETTASNQLTREEQSIRLPVEDAAKLQALAEMYPQRSVAEIITDLLSAALDDVESSMSHVNGKLKGLQAFCLGFIPKRIHLRQRALLW